MVDLEGMEEATTSMDVDLGEVIDSHHLGVWRYLRFLGCDQDQADDLTQECFLGMLDANFEYRDAPSTSAFLRLVAKRLYLNLMKRPEQRKRVEVQDYDGLAAPKRDSEVDEASSVWERFANEYGDVRIHAFEECFKKLRGQDREVIEAKYRDSLPFEEVALQLGLTQGNAKVIASRGIEKVRNCIEERLKNE